MAKSIADLQEASQSTVEPTTRMFGTWNSGWQVIADEMTEYTKRSFEDGTATFEKLIAAKSIDQAIQIQTGYTRRAYENYIAQMSKIGGLYASFAQDAYTPETKSQKGAR